MRASFGLLVLLSAIVFAALWFRHDVQDAPHVITAMSVGFLMLGAWLCGRIMARLRLPRISGYLIFGLLVGPSAWAVIWEPLAPVAWLPVLKRGMPLIPVGQLDLLQLVKDLAIAMIAITAGGEIRLDWLRGQWRMVLVLTMVSVLGAAGLIVLGAAGAMSLGLPMFGAVTTLDLTQAVVALALLGVIASGNSPSIAIALINECRADGPLSRTMLAITVCKDLAIVFLFATLLAIGQGIADENTELSGTFLGAVIVELGGSLGGGVLLGLVMAWFVEHVRQHMVFFVVGCCFLFALIGDQKFYIAGHGVHLHPLLMALAAGMTMSNFRPRDTEPLFHTIENLSLPVYCLFFAVAGADLDLSVFASGAAIAAVLTLVGLRLFSVWAVISLTVRGLGVDPAWRRYLWMCLLPQAGVTLALATVIHEHFEGIAWAEGLYALLLGAVAINALLGPVACRWALMASGEAGRMDGGHTQH